MSNWWVINKETKAMIYSCDDAGKEHCSIGENHEWLICPEGISPSNCIVVVASAFVPAVLLTTNNGGAGSVINSNGGSLLYAFRIA